MCYRVTNTHTTVKEEHAEKVREILDTFEFRGFAIALCHRNGKWILEWSREEDSGDSPDQGGPDDNPHWFVNPQAILLDELPERKQVRSKAKWESATDDIFLHKGTKGFTDFLGQLAAYIDEPMTLLFVTMDSEDCLDRSTQVFIVKPGQTDVETLDV